MGWSPWIPHAQRWFLLLCVKATQPQKSNSKHQKWLSDSRWTIRWWRSCSNSLALTASCRARSSLRMKWETAGRAWLWRFLIWLDHTRGWLHSRASESVVCVSTNLHMHKYNLMLTLSTSKCLNNSQPKVALPVSYQIFLLLGWSPGSNSARLENFNLVYSFSPASSSMSVR